MRIKLAQTNSKKRYLVFTTDDARKRAVDPTRLLAYSQPQNRYFRARVEKVGLAVTTSTRWEGLPDIPTVGEFLPGFEVCAAIWWFTFLLVAVLLGIFVVV